MTLLDGPSPPPHSSLVSAVTHSLRGHAGRRSASSAPTEAKASQTEEPSASKTYEMLVGMAGRRTAPVPVDWLVSHVLRLHGDHGWVVIRAAFEALLRRVLSARRDELRVHERPRRGEPFGEYRTRRPGRGGARPWRTWLISLQPLRASCDCPDFTRNGLGLCKHVFAALADVAERPRARARAERGADPQITPALDWDPVRPLVGAEPWWWRLRFSPIGPRPRFAASWVADEDGALRPSQKMGWERSKAMLRECARYARRHPDRVTPAARAMLAETREHAETDPLATVRRGMRSLRELSRPLYGYQRDGVRRFLETERLLLADDMGLGKTAQAIACCHALHHAGRAEKGLLIVPAALKSQWLREWCAFTDRPATVVAGPPSERHAIYRSTREGFLIVNYELLRRDLDELKAWGAQIVVLDEAQRIKNWQTKTARAVKTLSPRYRLALTGTPLENRLEELASLMDWVDDRAMEPKWRLAPVHGGAGVAGNLDTLRARIQPSLLRRRRAEILSELPPRSDTTVPVPMTRAQAAVHDPLSRPIAQLVHTSKRRPLRPPEQLRLMELMTRQRIVANGLAQSDFEEVWPTIEGRPPDAELLAGLHAPKLEALREVLRSLVVDQGRRVVVFSQWRRMLRLAWWATRDVLAEVDGRAVFFTGAESARRRDQSVVELHDDPRTRVLFASDAGGVGLNLQRAATACVNLELPWNPAVLEQRVARIHRLGQQEPIDVINLVTQDSIESRIEQLCGAKQALFEALFDSDATAVAMTDRSLAERLVDQLDRPVDIGPDPTPTNASSASGEQARAPSSSETGAATENAGAASRVQRMIDALEITPRADGGVVIEASQELAAELLDLLRRSSATPDGTASSPGACGM